MDQIRQGDVLLTRVRAQRGMVRQEAPGIRIAGERTGHAHVLAAEVYTRGERTYARLGEPGILLHEEHAPLEVPAGWWEVTTQREFLPRTGSVRRWD